MERAETYRVHIEWALRHQRDFGTPIGSLGGGFMVAGDSLLGSPKPPWLAQRPVLASR